MYPHASLAFGYVVQGGYTAVQGVYNKCKRTDDHMF